MYFLLWEVFVQMIPSCKERNRQSFVEKIKNNKVGQTPGAVTGANTILRIVEKALEPT